MANAIKVKDLSSAIEKAVRIEIEATEETIQVTAKEVAEETVRELEQTSPHKSGDYARAWSHRAGVSTNGQYDEVVFVEAPHYRLTHLLEYGHALVNGNRSKAIPHIKPAEEKAVSRFIDKVIQKIERGQK